jgi:diguanylate cyclase (GGDEF)-like protein
MDDCDNALDQTLGAAGPMAYLDPERSRAIAEAVLAAAPPQGRQAAWALWYIALSDVRTAGAPDMRAVNERARATFASLGDKLGIRLCDELEAIRLRREHQLNECAELQARIDASRQAAGPGRHAADDGQEPVAAFAEFLSHNSRAITAKRLGQHERALTHFYAALSAAEASTWDGLRITALGNLGGFHHDLFNLLDARELSERAFDLALRAGAKPMVTTAGANLIVIRHAAGQNEEALEMAQFLVSHPDLQVPDALDRVPLPLALAYLANGDLAGARRWLAHGAVGAIADSDGVIFHAWLRARLDLAEGEPARARELAERVLRERGLQHELPYEAMQLVRAAADACERLGDHAAALAHTRQAHAVYERLVGRSAQARYRALQVAHETAQAEADRDLERRSREAAEQDRQRLANLNRALEAKIAETELLHAKLREQALRDALTGLHNRRYLFEVAPGLIELARRQGTALAFVLLDIDHFKALNDVFGHGGGDAVLQGLAQLLGQHLRRSDVLARMGGEEFVIVMPDVDTEAAVASAERLLELFRNLRVPYRSKELPRCTFSAGVAAFPEHGDSLEQLVRVSDKAMYAAKAGGRARVMRATSGFMTLT